MIRLLNIFIFKLRVLMSNPYNLADLYRSHYNVKIGKGCIITGKRISFGSEPYLIEIGDNVRITADVKFQTHDGGVGVFRDEFPGLNVFGKIKIGSNTFLGHSCMIMPGVSIGDNTVIAAGSIVTKNIPSNSVFGGVPAKFIKTIDEYKKTSLEKGVFIESTKPELRKVEILNFFLKRNLKFKK